jgi:hypothetical protein
MAGTSASLIIKETNQVDGYVVPIAILGNINIPFANLVSSISVHNVTNDFVRVTMNTVVPSIGNQTFILAPQSTQSISNPPEAIIASIDVLDLGTLGKGGGWIVANGFFM